jgi:predicted RND superfamily exporter protein
MIPVFASFIFDEDTIVKSMGLALAFGVLFVALIVHLTLVPALQSKVNDWGRLRVEGLGKGAYDFRTKWRDQG